MLALVRIALARPLTFVVMAVLIALIGPLATLRTPVDILPDIDIPVIVAVWQYQGLPAPDMAGRIVYYYERSMTSTVNNIEHIESNSVTGTGVVKIYFQPGTDIRTATAQVTSISQTVLKQMPPGITPPQILNYSASTVPILQLAFSSPTLGEQKIYDTAQNFIRPALATVNGAATPSPYGGKVRQIQIDLDPVALQSKGLSAADVENAVAAQNLIIPAGAAKIGQFEYDVELNDSPEAFEALGDLPIRTVDGATIYVRDVAQVRDGSPPQTNVVRVNGSRSVLMTVLKSGSVSTLDIVAGVKKILPRLELTLPPSFKVLLLGDQSVFVQAAVSGVIREGVIAAALTSLMILLFLGSWRSSLIISLSIPLAILISITALSALGQTLNVMTLGGLSLAVGILVDDATVTIENINFHLEQAKPIQQAIMDGARQIVTPAFVSLLCICIVFVPMFFLPGVSGFLFVPLAEAVVFAMIGSFILSRTLVPTLAGYLLRMRRGGAHEREVMEDHDAAPGPGRSRNPFARFQHGFERRFEGIRLRYRGILAMALERRRAFLIGFMAVVLLSFGLVPFLGQNFFPSVDAGQIDMHVRVPTGTRIEETAAQFDAIEQAIRETIPPAQTADIVDNIGLPFSGINLAFQNTGTIGPQDGDVYVSLKPGHAPTAMFVKRLRQVLPERFPGTTFAFLPADIISQILNFGAPAPIDVQITGPDSAADEAYLDQVLRRLRKVPGLVDVRIQQATNYPELKVDVNRTEADRLGVTERDVTNSLSTSLAGSGQTAPAYWLNPKNGVSYPIVTQSPQYRVDTLSDLVDTPVSGAGGQSQLLGATAEIHRGQTAAVISHYAIAPAFDIFATIQDRDLGAVAADIQTVLRVTKADVPKGAVVTLRGQVQTMNTAFSGLLFGLLGAFLLIYLIIVVNFQSWLDPFVIVTALPAALAGIVWMLFITGTPLSVPALIGAIMCMGVATANSILVVSFCREQLEISGDPLQAALTAGFTRFRPVLMTALAMIIGLAPMALALGEGGEQNAPLGRAVIGGLLFATLATLLFVPVVFSLVHGAGQGAEKPASPPEPIAEPAHAH
jgi:multidrug efflux pump subunit AcrB